ncbi:MAG: Transcriptional regulatory protein YycF [Chloroflexi bacterium ADurb.Bin360]|nr:MAG: Transcriptional regulatory protein YycF [Chloroflexi bacterium ADurb.Bin360]
MSEGRILVVEDDSDISNMLQLYFRSLEYEVHVAPRGKVALEVTRQLLPNVIVLDIMLPDIDGYEVCRLLRTNLRTSHIPILFLTQKDERSDKIHGLELGADDYITKPFDVEELRLRVRNTIKRAEIESLTSPTTGLPSGRLIEQQLRQLLRLTDWGILYIGIAGLDAFNEVYGFVAGEEVLRFTALVLSETVESLGSAEDFIGHIGGDNFIVITRKALAGQLKQELERRFEENVGTHYDFMTRMQGYLVVRDSDGAEKQVPLMRLQVGVLSADEGPFTDIREVTEAAAEARRRVRKA